VQVSWRGVPDAVDAVEAWITGQSYWVQVPVLLLVLLPLAWVLAGLIDRIVDRILEPHTRREIRLAAHAAVAHADLVRRSAAEELHASSAGPEQVR